MPVGSWSGWCRLTRTGRLAAPRSGRVPLVRRRGVSPRGRQAPHGGAFRRPPRNLVSETPWSTRGTTPAAIAPVAAISGCSQRATAAECARLTAVLRSRTAPHGPRKWGKRLQRGCSPVVERFIPRWPPKVPGVAHVLRRGSGEAMTRAISQRELRNDRGSSASEVLGATSTASAAGSSGALGASWCHRARRRRSRCCTRWTR